MATPATKPATELRPIANNSAIEILQPKIYDVDVLSVERVEPDGKDAFIAIVARQGNERLALSCSIAQYERMGIEAKLPVGCTNMQAAVYAAYIPDNGQRYGYRDRANNNEIVEYTQVGRHQLVQVDASNVKLGNDPFETYKMVMGKAYIPAEATPEEREVFLNIYLKK